MMTAQRLIVAVVALSLCILLVMPGQRRQAGGGEASMLLGRDNAVANAMGRPEQLWTGTPEADGLYNNMGAANLKLSGTIQTLDASRHNPNLAAAVHSLQESTQASDEAISDLHNPLAYGHALQDPNGFMKRLHKLRSNSAWCQTHPRACSALVPGQEPPLIANEGLKATGSKAKTQSLYLDGVVSNSDVADSGMPWLDPYTANEKMHEAHDDEGPEGVGGKLGPRPIWTVRVRPGGLSGLGGTAAGPEYDNHDPDPLWCGQSACAEKSFARHRHSFAQNMAGFVHNVPAITSRTGHPAAGADSMQAPTTSLAEVDTLTGGSGTMAYQGREDSLLPHGQLWGLGSKAAVRYHEYPGFYEGTQPDRAATESQQQAASEGYGLEKKELSRAMLHIQRGKQSVGSSPSSALSTGEALFELAGSRAGKIALPGISRIAKMAPHTKGIPSSRLPAMAGESMTVLGQQPAKRLLGEEEEANARRQEGLDAVSRLLNVD